MDSTGLSERGMMEKVIYSCKGYGCDNIAPEDLAYRIQNDKVIDGWYCSSDCYYHPLNSHE